MSNILCIWELGGYLGHLTRLVPIAEQLTKQGHHVSFIVRNLARAELILGNKNYKMYQAPIWLMSARNIPNPPESFPEILMQFGYLDTKGLSGLVKAWLTLFEQLKPDLFIFDYAPTALIAARKLNKPKVIVGGGFFTPPPTSPIPQLRTWADIESKRLEHSETLVLATINKVLSSISVSPIEKLYELFNVDQNYLTTYPELDFYSERKNAHYCGPVEYDQNTINPQWQHESKSKIFAYIKSEYGGLKSLLDALTKLEHDALIFSPNISKKLIDQYTSETIRFSREPLSIKKVIEQCDVSICHSGDMMLRFMIGGVPQLLVPMQLEQYATAIKAQSIGCALLSDQSDSVQSIAEKINQLVSDASYKQQLKDFMRNKNREVSAATTIAEGCNELIHE